MEIIDRIAALCAEANPDYRFMHEEAEMINVKADALARGDRFVYVEAVRTGAYTRFRSGVLAKTFNVRVYFCRFTGFGNDLRATVFPGGRVASTGAKNEEVLDAIETEIVAPFIKLLDTPVAMRQLTGGQPWARIPVQYPPSRYDGNELSVMLELTVTEPIC